MDRRLHRGGYRTDQPTGEVYEVASLTQQPPAPLLRVVEPVIVGKTTRIHPHENLPGMTSSSDVLAQRDGERGVTTIEADRQLAPAECARRPKTLELVERQAWRLLDEHGLAGQQPALGKVGVTGMPRRDHK